MNLVGRSHRIAQLGQDEGHDGERSPSDRGTKGQGGRVGGQVLLQDRQVGPQERMAGPPNGRMRSTRHPYGHRLQGTDLFRSTTWSELF